MRIADFRKHMCIIVRRVCDAYTKEHDLNTTLSGLCCTASFALYKTFRHFGYASYVVGGSYRHLTSYTAFVSHYWLVSGYNIIDITATQFGVRNKVLILPRDTLNYRHGRPVGIRTLKQYSRESDLIYTDAVRRIERTL